MQESTAELSGRTLAARYVLGKILGRGASSVVYHARDLATGTDVAVKVLRSELVAASGRQRFLREVRIASQLVHPNIVPVLDAGDSEGATFCVMPLVTGSSLRERMNAMRQLSLPEGLAIGASVCEALAYAHEHGVVHRDVKPENILLEDGMARLADFGIARGIELGTGDRLTSSGIAIGTPAYMSPEQAVGDAELEGRSDVYSLACVIYEMLAGVRPFVGPSSQNVIAQRLSRLPLPLGTYRATAGPDVESLLIRAFALSPADRPTSRELADALGRLQSAPVVGSFGTAVSTVGESWATRYLRGRRLLFSLAAVVAVVAAIGFQVARRSTASDGESATSLPAPLRWLVLPFEGDTVASIGPGGDLLLSDAIARFEDMHTIDQFQVHDAVARFGGAALRQADARSMAQRLRAGRFVRTRIARRGEGYRIEAVAFDTGTRGEPVSRATIRMGADRSEVDAIFRLLADSLLFGKTTPLDSTRLEAETTVAAARRAFLSGQQSLREWDLEKADSGLRLALRLDPGYARAEFWLAQVREWSGQDAAGPDAVADIARNRPGRLSPHERQLARALAAVTAGDFEGACRSYRALVARDSSDFAAWFGLAECLRRDPLVVRATGPGPAWVFRSSQHAAVTAYRRAFALVPLSGRVFRDNAFGRLRTILLTSARHVRAGMAEGRDSVRFAALPEWDERGDSLVFRPLPLAEFATKVPAGLPGALRRNRATLRAIAEAWVRAFPSSPEAQEALSLSLELDGDPRAVQASARARSLATSAPERARMGVHVLVQRIRASLPDDTKGLRSARLFADSLQREASGLLGGEVPGFAAATALVPEVGAGPGSGGGAEGRGSVLAGRPRVSRALGLLEAEAARGGPAVSRAWAALQDAFDRESVPTSLRGLMVRRAALLALPNDTLPALHALPADGDETWLAAQSLAAGRLDTARAAMRRVAGAHQGLPAGDLTIDAVVVEAELLHALGEGEAALALLDKALNAVDVLPPEDWRDLVSTTCLLRVMRLRVAWASPFDPSASRWRSALDALGARTERRP